MRLIVFLVSAFGLVAGELRAPAAGFAVDSEGSLIQVSGIGGAFTVGVTERRQLVSAAFSGKLGLLKTKNEVIALDATGETEGAWEAPSGPARFGFDRSGAAALAWYPEAGTLMLYRAADWRRIPFDVRSGSVLSLALTGDESFDVAVRRDDAVSLMRVRIADGAIEAETALGPADLVYLNPGGGTLVVRGRTAERGGESVELAADPMDVAPMSSEWIAVRTRDGVTLAVSVTGAPRVWELPAVRTTEAQQ